MGLIVLALAGSGAGVYAYRQKKIRTQFIAWRAEGMAAAAEGSTAKAVDLLGRYLSRYPNDTEALARYAYLRIDLPMEQNAHVGEAIRALRYLLRLQPDRHDDRRQLMKLYASVGFTTEALDAADELLKKWPDDVDALRVKAETLAQLGKFEEALKPGLRWSELEPQDADAQMTAMHMMLQARRPKDQVEKFVAERAGGGGPRFELFQAYALGALGQGEAARERLRALATVDLPDQTFALRLVRHLDHLQMQEESLWLLGRWSASGGAEFRRQLSRRYWEQGRSADVVSALVGIDPASAEADSEALAIKALSLSQLGRNDEAGALRAALAKRDKDVVAKAWAALLEDMLAAAPGAKRDPRALFPAFREALLVEPGNAYLRYFLGDAYARIGETELAAKEWEAAGASNVTWATPMIRLAHARLDTGRLDGALQAAHEGSRRAPNSVQAGVAFVRTWSAAVNAGRLRGDADLLKALEHIQKEVPGEEVSLALRVSHLARRGQVTEAGDAIRAALAGPNPLGERALARLAALSQEFKLGLEDACFERSEKDHGVTADLALARSARLHIAGKTDEGRKLFDAMRQRAKTPSDLSWQLASARFLDLIGDAGALAAFAAVAEANPQDLGVQQAALAAQCARADRPFMLRSIERVRALTGEDGLSWRQARARWLLEGIRELEKRPDKIKAREQIELAARDSLSLLNEVVRKSPESVDARLLTARAQEVLGRLPEAIVELQAAAELRPDAPSIRLALSRMLQARGDFDRAREQLNLVPATALRSSEQRRHLAYLRAQQGEYREAIELLEEEARQSADEESNDLFLANLYYRQNQPAKAEEICRKMLAKSPGAPEIQFAASFFAAVGKTAEAKAALAKLDGLANLTPGLKQLILADYAMRYEDADVALRHLQDATAAAPTSGPMWRALTAYYLAVGRAHDAMQTTERALAAVGDDEVLRAVRHNREMVRFASESPSVRPVLLAFLRDPTESSAAGDALRLLYAAHQAKQAPMQYVDRLAALADKHPRFLPLQMHLARLYQQIGRVDDALFVANRSSQASPDSSEPPGIVVGILAQQERWVEMLEAAQRWRERLGAKTLEADLAIAEAKITLKRHAEAMQQLEPYLAGPAADDEARQRATALYAKAEQAIGQSDVKVRMEALLKQGPRGRRLWVMFALENLGAVEAERWLKLAEAEVPKDSAGEELMIAAAWGDFADRHKRPAAAELARARFADLAKRPDDVGLSAMVALGDRLEKDGDPQKSEATYRAALARRGDLAVVQNNLAMLIVKHGGNLDDARVMVQRAIQTVPTLAPLYDTLAHVEAKAGRHPAALDGIRAAIRLQPKNVEYRLHLVALLMASGDTQEATQALKEIEAMGAGAGAKLKADAKQRLDAYRQQLGLAAGRQ